MLNSEGRDDKNHTRVYRLADITANPSIALTRGGFILIGLLSGGDYHTGGVMKCGPTIAHGLAKCGFGDTLYTAAMSLSDDELPAFLANWRNELRHELQTNSRGIMGRKNPSLSKAVPDDFPRIEILRSYTHPITSVSLGRPENYLNLNWKKEPDLGKLAATCEFYFEWGYKEAIIKRFRTVIWPSAVLRIMRRAVLLLDEKAERGVPSTPRKSKANGGNSAPGTPSRMIAKHFSSMTLHSPSRRDDVASGLDSDSECEGDQERLVVKIHGTRQHASTDGIVEYRLEVAPLQLARLAEAGIHGIRQKPMEEWSSEHSDVDSDAPTGQGKGKAGTKAPPDPGSHLRVWVPASIVRLVEPALVSKYDEEQKRKRAKKAGVGKGKKKVPVVEESEAGGEGERTTRARKGGVGKGKKKVATPEASDEDVPQAGEAIKAKKAVPKVEATLKTAFQVVKPTKKTTAKSKPGARVIGSSGSHPSTSQILAALDDDDSDTVLHPPARSGKGGSQISDAQSVDGLSRGSADPRQLKAFPVAVEDFLPVNIESDDENDLFVVRQSVTRKAPRTVAKPSTLLSTKTKKVGPGLDRHPQADGGSRRERPTTSTSLSTTLPLAGPSKARPRKPVVEYMSVSDSDDGPPQSSALRAHVLPTHGLKAFFHVVKPTTNTFSEAREGKAQAKAVPASPSKRGQKSMNAVSSDSDSVPPAVHKSPRKSVKHLSPRSYGSSRDGGARAVSPTPASRPTGGIIEISSDSDSDLPPVSAFAQPLLVAKARARSAAPAQKGQSVRVNGGQVKRGGAGFQVTISASILDLT